MQNHTMRTLWGNLANETNRVKGTILWDFTLKKTRSLLVEVCQGLGVGYCDVMGGGLSEIEESCNTRCEWSSLITHLINSVVV